MEVHEKIGTLLRQKQQQLWSVSPDASVYQAIELMADKQIGALLVLSEGKLAGVISERDYARKVILKGKSSRQTPVSEIMTSPVITVTPEHTVDECMRVMTGNRIRHLPVMDGDELLGILSIGDLVKAIISNQAHAIDQLTGYISGRYPA